MLSLEASEVNTPLEVKERSGGKSGRRTWPIALSAAAIVFAINLAIVFCIAVAPDLNVELEGQKADPPAAYASAKPSPFTQTVTTAPKKLRSAIKLTPVLSVEPSDSYSAANHLNVPGSAFQNSAYGTTLPRSEPKDRDYTDSTAMTMSRSTERGLHVKAIDLTPRRSSERERRLLN